MMLVMQVLQARQHYQSILCYQLNMPYTGQRFSSIFFLILGQTIRYDTRCYFNVRAKADISQLNLPHGTDN